MKKNQKGSALIWAISIIMVLMVTISGALAISYTYYAQSVIMNNKRQAYVNAKSIIMNIVDNITSDEVSANKDNYLALIPDGETQTSHTLEIKNYPEGMGSVNHAFINRVEEIKDTKPRDILTISVELEYADQISVVNAELVLLTHDTKWQLLRYYEGEVVVNENSTNSK